MKKLSQFASLFCAVILSAAVARAAGAADNWAKNCIACHGADGAGHTKAGRMKGVKDMTDAQYQKGFTDDEAAARIKDGLNDASGNSKMKAFGDTLSGDEIKDLVAYVRSLKK
jgi:mono/diheme cytochrome c family protein